MRLNLTPKMRSSINSAHLDSAIIYNEKLRLLYGVSDIDISKYFGSSFELSLRYGLNASSAFIHILCYLVLHIFGSLDCLDGGV